MRVRLGSIDEIALDVSGTVTERLDGAAGAPEAPAGQDTEDEDAELASPLALAIDVNEAEAGSAEAAPAP